MADCVQVLKSRIDRLEKLSVDAIKMSDRVQAKHDAGLLRSILAEAQKK